MLVNRESSGQYASYKANKAAVFGGSVRPQAGPIDDIENVIAADFDENAADLLLNLPFNSLDGVNTNYTDYGRAGFTWTPEGNIPWDANHNSIITSYNGAARFEGQPDRCLSTTSDRDIDGDWTVTWWSNFESNGSINTIFRSPASNLGSDDDTGIVFWSDDQLRLYHILDAPATGDATGLFFTPNTWEHWAVNKKNDVVTVYKNGVLGFTIGGVPNKRLFQTGKKTYAAGPGKDYYLPGEAATGYMADLQIFDKAMIEGDFDPNTDGFGSTVTQLKFQPSVDLSAFKHDDRITEVGNGNDGQGRIFAVDEDSNPKTVTLTTRDDNWDVGSDIKGTSEVTGPSAIQSTDHLLVNRGGASFHCTGADFNARYNP